MCSSDLSVATTAHLTNYHFEYQGVSLAEQPELCLIAPQFFVPLAPTSEVLSVLADARTVYADAREAFAAVQAAAASNNATAPDDKAYAAAVKRVNTAMRALYDAETAVRRSRSHALTLVPDLYASAAAVTAHIRRLDALLAVPGACSDSARANAEYSVIDEYEAVERALAAPAPAGTLLAAAAAGVVMAPDASAPAGAAKHAHAHGHSHGHKKDHKKDASSSSAAAPVPFVPAYLRSARPFAASDPSGLPADALHDLSAVALTAYADADAAAALASAMGPAGFAAAADPGADTTHFFGVIAPAGTFTLSAAAPAVRAAVVAAASAPSAARAAAGDVSYWEIGLPPAAAAAAAPFAVKVAAPAAAVLPASAAAAAAASAATAHVLCVTATTYGFYVNASTDGCFAPAPASGPRAAAAHSLHALLASVSPFYAAGFARHVSARRFGHPAYYAELPRARCWAAPAPAAAALALGATGGAVTTTVGKDGAIVVSGAGSSGDASSAAAAAGALPASAAVAVPSPFAPRAPLGPADGVFAPSLPAAGRTALAAVGGSARADSVAARVAAPGWEDELALVFALPETTVTERLLKERAVTRVLGEFVSAAVAGAVAVVDGAVASLNEADPTELKIYLRNGIFYSSGVDGKGWLRSAPGGGDAAVADFCELEVRAFETLARAGAGGPATAGVACVASLVVTYRGRRVLAQSTVPGIFQAATTVLSGSIDGGAEVADLATALAAEPDAATAARAGLQAVQRALHLRSHRVLAQARPDASDGKDGDAAAKSNSTEVFLSVEGKALRGSDKRVYLLDVARALPRDTNFPSPAAAPSAVLRPEALSLFAQTRAYKRAVADKQEAAMTRIDALRSELDAAAAAARDAYLAADPARSALLASVSKGEADVNAPEVAALSTGVNEAVRVATAELAAQLQQASAEAQAALRALEAETDALYTAETLAARGFNADAGGAAAAVGCTLADSAEDAAADTALLSDAAAFLAEEAVPRFVEDVTTGALAPLDCDDLVARLHARGLSLHYAPRVAAAAEKALTDAAALAAQGATAERPAAPPAAAALVYLIALLKQAVAARAAASVVNDLLTRGRDRAAAAAAALAAAVVRGDAAAAMAAANGSAAEQSGAEHWTPAAVAARALNALVGPASAALGATAEEAEAAVAAAEARLARANKRELRAFEAAVAARDPAAAAALGDKGSDSEETEAETETVEEAAETERLRFTPVFVWAAIRTAARALAPELPFVLPTAAATVTTAVADADAAAAAGDSAAAAWGFQERVSLLRAVCLATGIELDSARVTRAALLTGAPETKTLVVKGAKGPKAAKAAAAAAKAAAEAAEAEAVALTLEQKAALPFAAEHVTGLHPVVLAPAAPGTLAATYATSAAMCAEGSLPCFSRLGDGQGRGTEGDAETAMELVRLAINTVAVTEDSTAAALYPLHRQLVALALAPPLDAYTPIEAALSSAAAALAIAQRRFGKDDARTFAAHCDVARASAAAGFARVAALNLNKALLIAGSVAPREGLWSPAAVAALANKLLLALPCAATHPREVEELTRALAAFAATSAPLHALQMQLVLALGRLALGEIPGAAALVARVATFISRYRAAAGPAAAAEHAPVQSRAQYWLTQMRQYMTAIDRAQEPTVMEAQAIDAAVDELKRVVAAQAAAAETAKAAVAALEAARATAAQSDAIAGGAAKNKGGAKGGKNVKDPVAVAEAAAAAAAERAAAATQRRAAVEAEVNAVGAHTDAQRVARGKATWATLQTELLRTLAAPTMVAEHWVGGAEAQDPLATAFYQKLESLRRRAARVPSVPAEAEAGAEAGAEAAAAGGDWEAELEATIDGMVGVRVQARDDALAQAYAEQMRQQQAAAAARAAKAAAAAEPAAKPENVDEEEEEATA